MQEDFVLQKIVFNVFKTHSRRTIDRSFGQLKIKLLLVKFLGRLIIRLFLIANAVTNLKSLFRMLAQEIGVPIVVVKNFAVKKNVQHVTENRLPFPIR